MMVVRIGIMGGGSFGTCLADLLAENGHDVRLWMRSQEICDEVNSKHTNAGYLEEVTLNPGVVAYTDIAAACSDCDILIISVPSRVFREVAYEIKPHVPAQCLGVVSATKGMDEDSGHLMSQVLESVFADASNANAKQIAVGIIGGPNLALEIARKQYAGTVVASKDLKLRTALKEALNNDRFRVYTNDDIFGVELGGALKNVYAIAFGIASELDLGKNAQSLLLTRSLSEIGRYALAIGANPLTFLGLAGVGDLFATATSSLSRNFSLGRRVAQGAKVDEAEEATEGVAEGVKTLKTLIKRSDELGLELPIAQALYNALYQSNDLVESIRELMRVSFSDEDLFEIYTNH